MDFSALICDYASFESTTYHQILDPDTLEGEENWSPMEMIET